MSVFLTEPPKAPRKRRKQKYVNPHDNRVTKTSSRAAADPEEHGVLHLDEGCYRTPPRGSDGY